MRRGASIPAFAFALAFVGLGCRDEPPKPEPSAVATTPSEEPIERPRDDPNAPPVRKDGTIFAETELMGTRVSINLWLDPGRTASEGGDAMRAAFDEIARIESIMSEWQPDSELSRFNAAAGGPPRSLSAELAEVLARSRQIAERTGGTFDPTFHAVGMLWSFRPGATPPSPDAIADKLALIGWSDLQIDAKRRRGRLARAGMAIGLGAIAKGYGVDRASAVLRDRGFSHHVVEAGGDTYTSGTKGPSKWMVGIQKPGAPGVVAALPSTNEAVVTSGDYQRYFEHEGRRYAHILDPRTGWPVEQQKSAQSVTVVAADATDADAFATAIAVMGPREGMQWVQGEDGVEALVIAADGEIMISPGLADRLVYP